MNKTTNKYGNNIFWCFIEDGFGKEVAIWKGPEGSEQIIARATDKYEAKLIVDALCKYDSDAEAGKKFGKKELAFLEFMEANSVEPYRTMASNAILWNDQEAYNNLKNQFPVIYS